MCVCICVCACSYVCIILALTRVKGLGMKVGCVQVLLSTPPFCIWKWSGTSLVSKAVVCWESNIVPAGSGCDSVDAISTMWTHTCTGYIPYLVTWQRFVHSTGYLLQHINTMSCKRITEVRPASIVPPPFLVHMHA